MNAAVVVDIVVLLMLGVAFITGYIRGAIRELFGAVAMVLAICISIPTYMRVGIIVDERFHTGPIAGQLISFIGLFVLIAILCRIGAWFVQKRIEESEFLKSFNKSLGGWLGLFKTAIILFFMALVFQLLPLSGEYVPPVVMQVKSGSLLLRMAGALVPAVTSMTMESKHVQAYKAVLEDPVGLTEKLGESPRFKKFIDSDKVQKLFNNEKVQQLLDDPKIRKMSENKDFVGLMKEMLGGKGRTLLNDPGFLKEGIPEIVEEFEKILSELPTGEVKVTGKPGSRPRPSLSDQPPVSTRTLKPDPREVDAVKRMMKDDRWKSMIDDPDLRKAADSGDMDALMKALQNGRALDLLEEMQQDGKKKQKKPEAGH